MGSNTNQARPLTGIRIIEICTTVAGPACGRLMADFGADVIKIEPPEGDPVRNMGGHLDGESLYATSILRGKRSVCVNLKSPRGAEIVSKLILSADVVLENNRPGVLEKFGLDYDTMRQHKKDIIYVRISGYGQTGSKSPLPGYGVICEAFAGVRHMTGDPDRPPARVALPTTDYLSSMYAAFGLMAALRYKEQYGKGQLVDVALYEAAFTQMEEAVPSYDKLGKVPMRQGPRLPSASPNSLYPTGDASWVLIAAGSNAAFRRLCLAMNQPQLAQDPSFVNGRTRSKEANIQALDKIIGEWTKQHTSTEVVEKLERSGVPVSKVYTVKDIFSDPHFHERDMLPLVDHPKLGPIRQIGVVPRLSESPGRIEAPGPGIGQDTVQVLRDELGYDEAEIQSLQEAGSIAIAS